MKIVNHFYADGRFEASEIYQFLKFHAEYIDCISISWEIFLSELKDRNITDVKEFMSRIFSNSFYRSEEQVITNTPALVFEIYEYLIADCNKTNSLPCVSDKGSFLDICYHYSIPIFIYDIKDYIDEVVGYKTNWKLMDWNIQCKLQEEYYEKLYYLVKDEVKPTDLDFWDPDEMINLSDPTLGKKLFKNRENAYNKLIKEGMDVGVYSKDSLTYLYDELIG